MSSPISRGVSVDTLLDEVEDDAPYVLAFSDGGYTTNLPVSFAVDGDQGYLCLIFAGHPSRSPL